MEEPISLLMIKRQRVQVWCALTRRYEWVDIDMVKVGDLILTSDGPRRVFADKQK